MAAISIAAPLLLFLNLNSASSAPVSIDCTGGTGAVSSSLATANANGATASDSLTVSNAPVGTTITINYTATSNNNKRARSSLASPGASGPAPAGPITINGLAGAGTQLWTKTIGADPVIAVTLTKTAVAGGAATMNWSATCTPRRTLSITNTTNGAEAGPVNGVLTVTQTSMSATNTVVSLSYGGTATNTADYSRPANVTIPAGSLSANVTLVVVDDSVVEVAETVIVTLGAVTSGSAAVVAPTSATNTIASNDVGAINITTTDNSATETPGDTGAFTVSLGAQPSGNVTVSIGTSPQCTRAPTSLTFTNANWNVAQTVTLTPTNDTAVEGPHTCSPASITAANGGYTGVTATPPTIDIADNDVGTITLVTTDSTATEAGNTGAFTVRLGGQPSASVTVTIGTSPQCNFSTASLTFTTVNWNTAQTVTVTPVNDAVVEGAHTCSPASITAANGNYDGVTAPPPTINISDNDVGTLVLAATDNAATEAPSDTGAFTVRLGLQPSADVTVTIAASAQCNFSATSLSFTTANWNETQSVTATPIDDAVAEGTHTCSPAPLSAANGGYNGVTAALPTINITDNDFGTINLTVTDDSATETPGDTGAFTISLSTQPSANVTVSIGTSPQCARAPTPLTFTTGNWNVAQTVTMTPNDDAAVEGPHTCAPASITAANGGYSGVTATPPTINITDNDVGTIAVVLTDGAATEAPGDTGAFTVVLSAQPSASVTVSIGTSPQCNRSPTSLTFTTANWNVARTVTLTPINDAVVEGPHTCSPVSITAANGGYTGVTATPPTINITDNDVGTITVVTTDAAANEAGNTGAFSVRLAFQPSASVTVSIGSSTQCNFSAASLVLTTANWNTVQTVTVTPIDDAVAEGTHTCSPASITAADGNYDGVTATAPTINIADNDFAGFAISGAPVTVTEAGSSSAFTIVLTSQPTGDVTVPLAASNLAETTVAPANLTFTVANWNIAQTVTVTGVDDAVDDGDVGSTVTIGPTASGDGNYSGLTPAAVGVTTTDDDMAGITVSGGPLTVTEAGSSATFTIVLTSQPTGDVSVPLAASNLAETTVAPANLTFTVANWNIAQTVTVTGVDDAVDDGDTVSSILIGATTSSDANYNGVTPAAVGVTTTDDDAMINAAVREAFEQQTHDFMARRQSLILSHEPSFYRLVNRGFAGWSRGENALTVHGYDGELRGSFSLNARSAAAVFSEPGNIENTPPYDPSTAWNAWAEGQFGLYSQDESGSESSGDFFIGYAGIDWRLNERLMIGIMGEFDWLHETSAAASGDVEGTGWMVGPYVSYAVSEKLFLDVRAMWGRSENQTAQDVLGSRYEGEFDTERWLVDARLAGLHRIGSLTIRPELGLTYMNEDQLDYAVSGNERTLSIDGQFVSSGMISAGGKISQSIPLRGFLIEPFLRGSVLWSFDDPLQASGTDISSNNALGGQVGVGMAVSGVAPAFRRN